MPIIAKSTGSGRETVPPGNYVARCYSIIEMGTQETTWEGKKKQQHKVRISFELPFETRVFDEAKGPQPMVIDIPRTLSLSKNARLRSELESWRGKPFTEEEAAGFDITKLLTVPCMLNVIHTEDGYSRVHAITPIPQGITVPPQVNPTTCLSFDNWNQPLFESLPDFIQGDITKSPEYQAMFAPPDVQHAQQAMGVNTGQQPVVQPPATQPPATPAQPAAQPAQSEQPDDMPF